MEISVTDSMEIRVVAGQRIALREINAFLIRKAKWISARLEEGHRANQYLINRVYKTGGRFLFLGKEYELVVDGHKGKQSKIDFNGNQWKVCLPQTDSETEREQLVKSKLIEWYRLQAGEIFASRIFHFERIMGLTSKEIAVRNQKRVWGSCGFHQKSINLNWKLVMTPIQVIDYVVVHELSHLKFHNHSKRFWQQVGQVLLDYKIRQNWLKINRFKMILP